MKFILLFMVSCVPVLDVKVATRGGSCKMIAFNQSNKDTLDIEYFCGSEGIVYVRVVREK